MELKMDLKEGQKVSTIHGIKTIDNFDYDVHGQDGTKGRIFMKEDKVDGKYMGYYEYKDIVEIKQMR